MIKKQYVTNLPRVALFITLTLAAAAPTPAATVSIGGQTKNTTGTLIDVNQGDIACYLSLRDDAGKPFKESADFDLCNNKLKGQRVQLGYSMANVQAASCQGDPNCKKSDRIALVTSMKPLGQSPTAVAAKSSHCTPAETVVFSCPAGTKLVSVCASRNLSAKAGYVQYRLGPRNAGEALEIALPDGEVHPLKTGNAVYGANDMYAGGGASWLRFRKGTYAYVVYSGIGRWGKNGETLEKQGLAVENNGKVIANLKCTGALVSELSPQWYEKIGYQRNDKQDFIIPD